MVVPVGMNSQVQGTVQASHHEKPNDDYTPLHKQLPFVNECQLEAPFLRSGTLSLHVVSHVVMCSCYTLMCLQAQFRAL